MKKIVLFALGIVLSFGNIYAQVGVNTETPLQLLHIDSQGNTTSTVTTQTDDVVVTSEGRVGIGTVYPDNNVMLDVNGNMNVSGTNTTEGNVTVSGNLLPGTIGVQTANSSAKLQIAASSADGIFRLADTSQSDGYLLTCDTTTGKAYWEALRPMSSIVNGRVNAAVPIDSETYPGKEVTVGNRLSLAPGKWLVFGKATTAGSLGGFYMYLYLAEVNGTTYTQITRAGEMAGTDVSAEANQKIYASPQFVYLLDVPNNSLSPDSPSYYKTYALTMTTSYFRSSTYPSRVTRSTTNEFGEGYFYAIRVDRANN